jgi:hypothetical protein
VTPSMVQERRGTRTVGGVSRTSPHAEKANVVHIQRARTLRDWRARARNRCDARAGSGTLNGVGERPYCLTIEICKLLPPDVTPYGLRLPTRRRPPSFDHLSSLGKPAGAFFKAAL